MKKFVFFDECGWRFSVVANSLGEAHELANEYGYQTHTFDHTESI